MSQKNNGMLYNTLTNNSIIKIDLFNPDNIKLQNSKLVSTILQASSLEKNELNYFESCLDITNFSYFVVKIDATKSSNFIYKPQKISLIMKIPFIYLDFVFLLIKKLLIAH